MSSALPNILHHYTNSDGLLGIFRDSAFWATKIHYLNDSSELVEPFNTAKEYLANLNPLRSWRCDHNLLNSKTFRVFLGFENNRGDELVRINKALRFPDITVLCL